MSLLPFPHVDSIRSLYDVDEIYDFINSGTYASVYRAVRKATEPHAPSNLLWSPPVPPGTVVALKVIQKGGIKTEKDARDIVNEVAIVRCVHHAAIVKLLEVFQTPREVVVVLQFVDGKELLQGVGAKAMPEVRARRILQQLVDAMQYLHDEKRVVHRDLKPENILLSPDDRVTVVDFGLAKSFGHRRRLQNRVRLDAPPPLSRATYSCLDAAEGSSTGHLPLLRSASVESVDSVTSHTNSPILATPCGTLKYAAPEAVRTMANHSSQWSTTRGSMPKLDMYSLGIIAYVMLSGQLPYDTKNKATLGAQMERGPMFDNPKWASISDDARDFVARLLVADPVLRMSASEARVHRWLRPSDDESGAALCGPELTTPTSEQESASCETARAQLSVAFQAMMPTCSQCDEHQSITSAAQHPQQSQVSYFF